MKFIKWLLPFVVASLFSTTSFAQINSNDSLAIIKLRNDLGLSAVSGLILNDPITWVPTYIDTAFDQATASFRITAIKFDNLATLSAITILPDSIINDTALNWVEYISLKNNGIDYIEGNLYAGSGVPPALKELNLGDNTFANTTDFFTYLLLGMTSIEVLKVNNALVSNTSPLTNYNIPTAPSLDHLEISGNNFTGTLDVTDLVTTKFPGLIFLAQGDLGGFISLVPLFNFCQLIKIGQKSSFKAKKRGIFYFFSQSQLFCSTQITLSHLFLR